MRSKQDGFFQAEKQESLKNKTNLYVVQGKKFIQLKKNTVVYTQLYLNCMPFFSPPTCYCFHCHMSLMCSQAILDVNFHQMSSNLYQQRDKTLSLLIEIGVNRKHFRILNSLLMPLKNKSALSNTASDNFCPYHQESF